MGQAVLQQGGNGQARRQWRNEGASREDVGGEQSEGIGDCMAGVGGR